MIISPLNAVFERRDYFMALAVFKCIHKISPLNHNNYYADGAKIVIFK